MWVQWVCVCESYTNFLLSFNFDDIDFGRTVTMTMMTREKKIKTDRKHNLDGKSRATPAIKIEQYTIHGNRIGEEEEKIHDFNYYDPGYINC